MSTAYPMMRSLPLLLTAAVTSIAGWGEPLTPLALLGMAIVFVGCMMMPMQDFSHFKWRDYLSSKMFFIFLVACGTTGYTIFDSQAQLVLRQACPDLAKPVVSMTFYSTRGIFLSTLMGIAVLLLPGEKKNFAAFFKERDWKPFAAGGFASLTYITVLMAMNYVTNVSYVQVFRQLGLIFGLLGGIFILKERPSLPKFIGVALIITGLVITVL
jgi:drug/metabolite transporter (DMT)-like permease